MYALVLDAHFLLSRVLLILAGLLFLAASGQALRRRDVTPWLRGGVYAVLGVVVIQVILGLALYVQGGRPLEPDIHLVYGVGALFVLPFFLYIEITAEKRPATGSYVLAGLFLLGLCVRAILTGG